MTHNQELGAKGENEAAEYLKQNGYEILTRNWRTKWGEIDIVAKQGEVMVFCEVKSIIKCGDFLAEDKITNKKLSQLRKLAQIYLSQKKIIDGPWQIDILAVEYNDILEKPDIRHLDNVVADTC